MTIESHRRTPVRHFLSEQKIVLGIESRMFRVWVVTLAILLLGAMMIHSWIVAAAGIFSMAAAFYTLRNMTKKDPYARRKYLRYMRQAGCYEPWPQIRRSWTGGQPGARPLGFGRDRLM